MKLRFFTLFLCALNFNSVSQDKAIDREWNGFYQKVDISDYEGGQFRLTAAIKADTLSSNSSAHMWARIDKSNGKMGYFNNMYDKPVKINKWHTYTLEGDIDKKAEKLVFGGLYFNQGRYYYDNFQLQLKAKNGEWVEATINNAGFESGIANWQIIDDVEGFEQDITTSGVYNGQASLVIDGRENLSYGNNTLTGAYAKVNGIKAYYEIYGEGEPLILLHGNSQSINAFKNQIPTLAEHYKVIAVDTRGQGNSTENGQKLTYELFAEDVLQLLDHLNLREVDLLGWSDGGNTGLILVSCQPCNFG